MRAISWNCRGIGNPRSARALHDMVRHWKPEIVFLMETKSKVKRMEKIKNRIGFANGLIVPSRGRSGGVALLWTREVLIVIREAILMLLLRSLKAIFNGGLRGFTVTRFRLKGSILGRCSSVFLVCTIFMVTVGAFCAYCALGWAASCGNGPNVF